MTADPVDLRVQGVAVARYQPGSELPEHVSPRPYLHPVRTLRGTVVTDARPADHDWHLGVGVAIQDVGGVNFWGGPTYVRDRGYLNLDDHGRIEHVSWLQSSDDRLREQLRWIGPDGTELLTEERSISAEPVDGTPASWALHWQSSLRNTTAANLDLGSPATHGRTGAGYGGFFWRLPPSTTPWRIFSPAAKGEENVHGTRHAWVGFIGTGAESHPYTLIFVAREAGESPQAQAARPWFVRASDYPGLCSALAFDNPVTLASGDTLKLRVATIVTDGHIDDAAVSHLIAAAGFGTPGTRGDA